MGHADPTVGRGGEDEGAKDRLEAGRPGAVAPLRMDALLSELQEHVERVRRGQDRMQTLLDAVVTIGSDLDLKDLLRRIVGPAVDLIDAEYGALGVLGEEGTIRQFITVGMDQETIERIGHYPEGHGILDLLIREPHPLRLENLGEHPESVGFPSGHPPMRTFLGAPVQLRENTFGNLYLTDKRGGLPFDADDEAVLQSLAAAAGVAIDNARLYDDSRHRERRLAASADMTRDLLSGAPPEEILRSLAATVQEMTGSDLVTLARPLSTGGELAVEAAAGERADQVLGLALPATTLAAKVAGVRWRGAQGLQDVVVEGRGGPGQGYVSPRTGPWRRSRRWMGVAAGSRERRLSGGGWRLVLGGGPRGEAAEAAVAGISRVSRPAHAELRPSPGHPRGGARGKMPVTLPSCRGC
ncbi:GAF domain-containing protein [Streptomyces varsoviensis]|uniref:GAF domain-containing protein n=1 Tax=Streptomyces varsoviensis TaxID=67373 RepID=UPI00099881C3|nr:GAF domain-containing protein [Streptomyces varsoviensis]